MRPLFVVLLILGHAAIAKAEDPFEALVRPTDALTPEEERGKLKVTEGFEVRLFASEPMINKPVNMAFDAKGRLWVSSTTEYPLPAEKDRWEDPQGSRVRGSHDAIKILEDTDGDGVADKVTDFVDGLNVPIGVLPYGKGCIAWSIPNIWYFEDTDGDGKADKRTVLFGPLGYEADTHGNIASLRLGEDGWIYATHGFNNLSRFAIAPERLAGRQPGDPGTYLELKSGNTFRFRPDGSAIEQWTRGQVNPFGLCFDAWGQTYSADCHSDPITQLLRGCTYHSFSMAPGPLGFAPTMCPHRHGSTGLCGLVYVDRGIWGTAWDQHMLIGNCVTSRINHDLVSYTGATAHATEQPDFLVPEDPWFRPVDLQIGPDHALYVADFYNKIIGHYEVDRHDPRRDRTRGRIWRIVRKESAAPRPFTADEEAARAWRWGQRDAGFFDPKLPPRVLRAELEQVGFQPQEKNIPPLLALLGTVPADDPAMAQSLRVALKNHLAAPGGLAALDRSAPKADEELLLVLRAVDTEESSLWLLRWLEAQTAEPKNLPDTVRAIARRLPAEREGALVALLRSRFPARGLELLRALGEGAAVHGGAQDPQMAAWAGEVAEQLLAEIEKPGAPAWKAVPAAGSPWGLDERKCADGQTMKVLTSLPPPRGGAIEKLTGTLVSVPFNCPPALSFWICGHRGDPKQPAHELNFVRLVDAGSHAELQRAYPPRNDVATEVRWSLGAHAGKQVQLELVDGDVGTAYAWLAMGRLEPALVAITLPREDERLASLGDLVGAFHLQALAPRLAAQMRQPLRSDTLVALASAVARFPGNEDAIAATLQTAPPAAQQRIAESLVSTVEGARRLLALAPAKIFALPSVLQKAGALSAPDVVAEFRRRAEAAKQPPSVLDQLIAKRAASYESARAAGKLNPAAGEQVFNGICIACHAIGGKGAAIGPALDGVKNRGPENLLTDIIDPNRAVDPAFRLHVITLRDQSIVTGMLRREEGATLVIADAAGQERAIAKGDIAKREESTLSLMPAGLGEAIPEEGLINLLAWLMSR